MPLYIVSCKNKKIKQYWGSHMARHNLKKSEKAPLEHHGQRLKEMSQERHIKQADIAQKCGISQQSLNDAFKNPRPGLDKFIAIMKAMDMEPYEYWIPKETRLGQLDLSESVAEFAQAFDKLKPEFKEPIIDLTFRLSVIQGTKSS